MWRRHDARQQTALARFISKHLLKELTQSVSAGRRRAQRGLLMAALVLLFVALAGPLVGYRWEQITRRGNEIVFAIDTSRSMSTPDVKPDRLTRAKLAIDDFTNKLDGDAVGLVAFAGSAFLVCPITLDYGAFHESLSAIDTNTIPRGGTNIASAIREAQAALRRRPGSDKILILVTDGEDLEGDALVAAQAAAQQDRLKIYTIGVGSPQGDLIPLPANQGGGFVKDESGGFVRSRLDEPALKAIARPPVDCTRRSAQRDRDSTPSIGRASPPCSSTMSHRASRKSTSSAINGPWRGLWDCSSAVCSSATADESRAPGPVPAPGSRLPPDGTRLAPDSARFAPDSTQLATDAARFAPGFARLAPDSARAARDPTAVSGVILLLLSLLPPNATRASTTGAEDAYKKGDYVTAEHEYAAAAQRDPKKPELQFNAGTAAYRAGQYSQAAQAFQESINRAPSGDAKRLAEQEDAYYNLGNTLYRTGQKTEESSPEQTMQTWTQAVKAYETALQLRPDDADSKFNRDFVKRKIRDLKQKQPPQNQSQNQQQNQPQNQPNNQNGQGQNNPQDQSKNQQQNPPPNQSPNQPPQQNPPQQNPPSQAKNGEPPPGQPPPGQKPPGQQPGQSPPGQQPPGQTASRAAAAQRQSTSARRRPTQARQWPTQARARERRTAARRGRRSGRYPTSSGRDEPRGGPRTARLTEGRRAACTGSAERAQGSRHPARQAPQGLVT